MTHLGQGDEIRSIMEAVLHLTMAGSINETTEVVLDPVDIAHVSGQPAELVERAIDALVELGAADVV